MNTHDYCLIDGKEVLHSTAVRDYVCGYCESGLVTLFKNGEWRTQCGEDENHTGFMKKTELQAIKTKQMARAGVGRDVFAHLPREVQEMMKGE